MQAIDDRCRPYRQARRNLAARHAGGRQPQHVTDVAHRQSRSWHWPPPSPVEKGVRPLGFADNPMVLRPHTSQRSTSLLGIARFSCSGSLGMAARDQSEQMLGINRNRCSGSPGAPRNRSPLSGICKKPNKPRSFKQEGGADSASTMIQGGCLPRYHLCQGNLRNELLAFILANLARLPISAKLLWRSWWHRQAQRSGWMASDDKTLCWRHVDPTPRHLFSNHRYPTC